MLRLGNGHGVEVFYNAAVTDFMHVTTDLQAIEPSVRHLEDTTLVAGIRVKLDLQVVAAADSDQSISESVRVRIDALSSQCCLASDSVQASEHSQP